ncbi:MAG: hypothetical protein MK212_12455 [Saprospiraceae bacterium]|nr:hypothetical protein [Saprospiraceae bacterium]
MYRFLLTTFILLIILVPRSQAQHTANTGFTMIKKVEKVTHQAFKTDEIVKVRFNIDPDIIEVRSTRSSRVLVETTIEMGSPSMPLLEYAIGTGRYELESVVEGGIMTITPKPRKHDIVIKGERVPENLKYVIMVPESLKQTSGM